MSYPPSNIASYPINYSLPTQFYEVGGEHQEKMEEVRAIFARIMVPVLGKHQEDLENIRLANGRKSFLLYENQRPIGLLVLKTLPTKKYSQHNITESLKLKYLLIVNPPKNPGLQIGTKLLNKMDEEIQKIKNYPKWVHLTIDVDEEHSFQFFKKHGFEPITTIEGRKHGGKKEWLFVRPTKQNISTPSTDLYRKQFKKFLKSPLEYRLPRREPELVNVIQGAHSDDIHAIKKLSSDTFVSGSKDNCLYIWNKLGQRVRVVQDVEPIQQDERNWITALSILNDSYFVSGERNGKVRLWSASGDFIKSLPLKFPKHGNHKSHEFNKRRVNCIAPGVDSNSQIFIGGPTMFSEYNVMESRTKTVTQVHRNDWVYTLNPLTEKKLLVGVGGSLHLWEKEDELWKMDGMLFEEEKALRKKGDPKPERAYISSVAPLQSGQGHFGFSLFDGSINVYDLETKNFVIQWNGHKGKAWKIEPISVNLFASSGEDRSIKLWDHRVGYAVNSIDDHVGQVTSLLAFDQSLLLAGTCPENPSDSPNGAEIRYYDVRL